MAELRALELSIVACLAAPDTLDRLVPPGHGTRTLRTAPDEVLYVAPGGLATDVRREVGDRVAALEPDALVLDITDGWAVWALGGAGAVETLAALSPLAPPPPGGWVQGDVGRVPAKVLADEDTLTILVPSCWRQHVRALARAAGAQEAALA